jgi:hypothetical protein
MMAWRPAMMITIPPSAAFLQISFDDPQQLIQYLAIGAAIFSVLLLLALITLFRLRVRQRRKVQEARAKRRLQESMPDIRKAAAFGQASAPPEKPVPHQVTAAPSRLLAQIGARTLLEQINHHVLKGRGEISGGKGELRLVWTDGEDQIARSIMITVQDAQTLLINGKPFPATRKGVQQGLIDCLRGLR